MAMAEYLQVDRMAEVVEHFYLHHIHWTLYHNAEDYQTPEIPAVKKRKTNTIFIRIEAPSQIEAPPPLEGNKIVFSNFTSIDSYILSHATNIMYENSWVPEIT